MSVLLLDCEESLAKVQFSAFALLISLCFCLLALILHSRFLFRFILFSFVLFLLVSAFSAFLYCFECFYLPTFDSCLLVGFFVCRETLSSHNSPFVFSLLVCLSILLGEHAVIVLAASSTPAFFSDLTFSYWLCSSCATILARGQWYHICFAFEETTSLAARYSNSVFRSGGNQTTFPVHTASDTPLYIGSFTGSDVLPFLARSMISSFTIAS